MMLTTAAEAHRFCRTIAAPERQSHDTPQAYASILALWTLAHIPDHGAIATAALSDAQLDSAAWGLNHALTQRLIIDEVSTPTQVYDRIARVLVFVRQRQTARAAAQAALIASAMPEQPSHPPDSHPSAGGKPVYPPTPAPRPLGPQHQEQPQEERAEVFF